MCSPSGYADESVWAELAPDISTVSNVQARTMSISDQSNVQLQSLQKFRQFSLDEQRISEQLMAVSAARRVAPEVSSGIVVSLPLPDGSFTEVEVVETQMFPGDAKAQAEFKTWEYTFQGEFLALR